MASKRKQAGRGRAGRKARASATDRNRTSFVTISLAVVAVALAALLGGLYIRGSSPREPAAETASVTQPAEGSAAAGPPAVAPEPAAPATASRPGSARPAVPLSLPPPRPRQLIFIIDDAGYGMKQLEDFLRLPFPLTIAVLPGLPDSGEAARATRAAGKELILHQPMQALGGQDPGPGAIALGMGRAEIERLVEANLRTVPGSVGMNNHMGSAVTTDIGIMEAVAAVAKRRGIYYVDSLTTSGTAVAVAARREGIPYWERDVFLDNTPDRASILHAVEEGKKRATKDRPAIMIGHVWSAELAQALTDLYPQLVAEGFSLSTISRFMVQEAEEDDASPGN